MNDDKEEASVIDESVGSRASLADQAGPPSSFIEHICFPAFASAATAAGVFELKVRLVLDRQDETREFALTDLSVALDKLITHFRDDLEPDEVELLKGCVVLRNKLFHQELSRVTGKLRALGEHVPEGGVWMASLDTGEAGAVAATSTRNGRIVGWLLESTASGAFAVATQAFGSAIGTLSALLDRTDAEAIARQSDEPGEPALPNLQRAIENMQNGARKRRGGAE